MRSDEFRRRRLLRAGVGSVALLALPPARGHEYFAARFKLIHPWTRESAPGATSAKICMTFEDVSETDYLIGATTPYAEGAEAGGLGTGAKFRIEIPKGKRTEFSEDGVHLRLTRLTEPLFLGRELPVTLVFAKSGELKASFLVDFEAKS